MKRIILATLLLISFVFLFSCRKSGTEPDIKQYDQQQIINYIAANGITGMQTPGGADTTGIHYKITNIGNTAEPVDYPDEISFVYTLRSFDGKFIAADTVLNHYYGYLGHVSPNGLLLAIHDILKYKGGQMRVLIPSHLAYGVDGVGTGSKTITNGKIAGNQCLDYTINLIDSQAAYDDLVIKNYMTANSLTGYTETADGLYYKITTAGTGASINDNSSVAVNYKGRLMNGTVFDSDTTSTTVSFSDLLSLTPGAHEGLKLAKGGGAISLLVPSGLGYGTAGSGTTIPANACLRFEFYNIAVTNY